MSEQAGENEPSAASAFGDFAAFTALMDTLAPEPGDEAAGQAAGADAGAAGAAGPAGGPAAGAAAGAGADAPGAGAANPGTVGGPVDTGAAGDTPGVPAAGDGGDAAQSAGGTGAAGDAPAGGAAGADAAGGGSALPASWTAEHTAVVPQLGELSTKLEEKVALDFQNAALAEAREEHGQYFEALEKHPRLLVGQQVPRIDGKEGHEVLKDTNDAREWQEAVKGLLVADVRDRASRAMDENSGFLTTLHASIELFQKNTDLVPFTKGFDKDLAERFATLAKPYELRDDKGKLNGYSIPVQPIIDSLRTQLTTERASRPAAPAVGTPAGAGAAAPAKPAAEPPQAGIVSKAGSSSEAEDFSTLFGTIGLPNFQI